MMQVESYFAREIGFIQAAVNYSEGCRLEVIEEIVHASEGIPDVVIADYSADSDHNRMVATYLGMPDGILKAVVASAKVAVKKIDLRNHIGVHPRIGAVDVIPFTPIANFPMESCITLAERMGYHLADEMDIPVFFYERNARIGPPRSLPEIRGGGFERLLLRSENGEFHPDLGPPHPHPTAGCTVVGARPPLVAWNVMLKTDNPEIAKRIAKRIRLDRASIPELVGVRAMGMLLPSSARTQVSMNLTCPEQNSMPWIFLYIRRLAHDFGSEAEESEVIGLIPMSVLGGLSPEAIHWTAFQKRQIIDNWIK